MAIRAPNGANKGLWCVCVCDHLCSNILGSLNMCLRVGGASRIGDSAPEGKLWRKARRCSKGHVEIYILFSVTQKLDTKLNLSCH